MGLPVSDSLPALLAAAFAVRAELMARLLAERTDAYRLFHGSVEGVPGLTVDRYGDLVLVQSFHRALTPPQLAAVEAFYNEALPGLAMIYNDRSAVNSRIGNALEGDLKVAAHRPRLVHEMGIAYRFQARHQGQDPWLFLDLRAARRRMLAEAAGKSVLNLFAYTCGIGLAASRGGAGFVVNVDFADSALKVGKENARLNDLPIRPRCLHGDVFAVVRQYAGLGQHTWVRGRRLPAFPNLEARRFDLVFLDPPAYAKSPFGVVDVVNDYPALFKPALLATAEGGTLICCNNVAAVDRDLWLDQLQRCARKAGRGLRQVEWIAPEADFPSADGKPPLKMALLRV